MKTIRYRHLFPEPCMFYYWLGGFWDGTKDRYKNAKLRRSARYAMALRVKAAIARCYLLVNHIIKQPPQIRTSWRRAG